MKDYVTDLIERYPCLTNCRQDIDEAAEAICRSVRRSGKVMTCGNGGSAADAEHIVGELMKGFLIERRLGPDETAVFADAYQEKGREIAMRLQKAVPAVALTGNVSLATAFANDVHPEFVFAQQVFGIGRPGDVLICLSTSGSSVNIVKAAMVARARGIVVVSLTGESGGLLKDYSDILIKAPSSSTPEIQEFHLPIYHALCAKVEADLFG